jgi:hypothetical protein
LAKTKRGSPSFQVPSLIGWSGTGLRSILYACQRPSGVRNSLPMAVGF